MVCGSHGSHSGDNCVCTVLRRIADVQDEVSPTVSGCNTSCEKSIDELLNGISPVSSNLDTIPLILYCGGCEPFKATGVKLKSRGNGGKVKLKCFQTFFFRVTSVDDDCCATLELLTTNQDPGEDFDDPCDQIKCLPDETIFKRTGVCITLDLHCLCGVTCLDAVMTS
ncbi:CotY/CotZ family spore coat protein [Neobacillus terrae]|uniref:CotY/CotZ family spore coat protein n=1 Tax=Neobacillus terrae TaxID=3034837 RepID=UPI00140E4958|nr:CotY/CotZ family spore coat protein [Neobacillus terrae]NHM32985.1 spore coat protein [Neobacillus terrae]